MAHPMDLEIMRGLSALCGDDPAAMQAMMGSMMGNAPQYYNQMSGPAYYNQLAGALGAMMGSSLVPADPQAMMGFSFLDAMLHRAPPAPMHWGAPPAPPAWGHPGGGSPFGSFFGAQAFHPIAAINPQIPGVSARGGRVQPLGFENGAFVVGGSAVVTVRARPERPFRGGRLVGAFTRTGATATGLLTLVSLQVGTDGQLISSDPISFDSLSPQSFGVQVDLTPAAVGNSIAATVAISALPTGAGDRVDFNLTAYGHTLG